MFSCMSCTWESISLVTKVDLNMLTDVYTSSSLIMKNLCLESRLSVCLDGRLLSAKTLGRISFTFGIEEFIRHRFKHGACEHSSSKNRNPWNGPLKTQNGDFLKNDSTMMITFLWLMETVISKYISIDGILRRAGDPNVKCRFCQNWFTDQTNVTVVRYQQPTVDYRAKINQFHNTTFKVTHIRQRISNVFAPVV